MLKTLDNILRKSEARRDHEDYEITKSNVLENFKGCWVSDGLLSFSHLTNIRDNISKKLTKAEKSNKITSDEAADGYMYYVQDIGRIRKKLVPEILEKKCNCKLYK